MTEELPAPSLFEFLLRSDLGYLFVRPSNDDVYHLDLLVRELRPQRDDDGVQLKPVLLPGEGELVDGYDALIQGVAGPVDVFIRGCPKSPDNDARPAGSFHAGPPAAGAGNRQLSRRTRAFVRRGQRLVAHRRHPGAGGKRD